MALFCYPGQELIIVVPVASFRMSLADPDGPGEGGKASSRQLVSSGSCERVPLELGGCVPTKLNNTSPYLDQAAATLPGCTQTLDSLLTRRHLDRFNDPESDP